MSYDDIPRQDYANNENMNAPVRSRFSAEEDAKLVELQQQQLDWNEISRQFGNRSPRQCRERFQNYLDPELNKSTWTPDEDNLLLKKESEMGKKWKKMMPYFQNRSNVNIKNRFTTLQNRKKANERQIKQNEAQAEQMNHENSKKASMQNFNFPSQQFHQFQPMQQNNSQVMLNDQFQGSQAYPPIFMPTSTIPPTYFDQQSFNTAYTQNSMELYQRMHQMAQYQHNSEQLQLQRIQQEQQMKQQQFQFQQQMQSDQLESSANLQQSEQLDEQMTNMNQPKQIQPPYSPPDLKKDENSNDRIIDEVFDDDQVIQTMWNFCDGDVGEKSSFF